MLKIYGSMLCPDCVQCRKELDDKGIAYEYLDFSDSLGNLKAFLKLRDTHEAFSDIRGTERIGIPCLVDEAGAVAFFWESLVN